MTTTPTTKTLTETIVNQIAASLNQTIPLLPKAFYRVLARVFAGVFILLYKYQGFIALQAFVSTASFKETEINGRIIRPLVEWGRLVGIGDPDPATNAELTISVTVENQVGQLDSGTQLLNSSNGVTYITIGAVLLNAPTVAATIRAAADQNDGGGAGAVGNLSPGDVVSFANPLANVAREATVTAQTVTGADAESEAAYRQRVIDRFQKRPQGGAGVDYEIWGEGAEGIINVYAYTGTVPGFVDLYSEATPESSGNPDGVPTVAQLAAVEYAVTYNDAGRQERKPINAKINSYAISRIGFNVTVTGLIVDNRVQVETDIESGVSAYLLSREPYIVGVSPEPRQDRIKATNISGIVDDVVSAAGGSFQAITLEKVGDGFGIDAYSLGVGEKSKLNSISFPV